MFFLSKGRYFDEISQDTGKYCFGVEDTLKALEMGAVEILIVYENLDTMRYILRVHGAESNGAENGKQTCICYCKTPQLILFITPLTFLNFR